jgi:hypothetical protein
MNSLTAAGTGPVRITGDTWLIPNSLPAGPELIVPVNSMVITGAEPVLIDTGAPVHRDRWLDAVFSVVDPADVRWVFLSHDDVDHAGNLEPVLTACPGARIVASFLMCERMAAAAPLPLSRLRWLEPGESLDIGDRRLHAVLPPLFDSRPRAASTTTPPACCGRPTASPPWPPARCISSRKSRWICTVRRSAR